MHDARRVEPPVLFLDADIGAFGKHRVQVRRNDDLGAPFRSRAAPPPAPRCPPHPRAPAANGSGSTQPAFAPFMGMRVLPSLSFGDSACYRHPLPRMPMPASPMDARGWRRKPLAPAVKSAPAPRQATPVSAETRKQTHAPLLSRSLPAKESIAFTHALGQRRLKTCAPALNAQSAVSRPCRPLPQSSHCCPARRAQDPDWHWPR